MVESTNVYQEPKDEDPYLDQLAEIEDGTLKTGLEFLYHAGYVDFEENKIIIESNPEMSMDDLMACIDASK